MHSETPELPLLCFAWRRNWVTVSCEVKALVPLHISEWPSRSVKRKNREVLWQEVRTMLLFPVLALRSHKTKQNRSHPHLLLFLQLQGICNQVAFLKNKHWEKDRQCLSGSGIAGCSPCLYLGKPCIWPGRVSGTDTEVLMLIYIHDSRDIKNYLFM